jgi:hypothetical protein
MKTHIPGSLIIFLLLFALPACLPAPAEYSALELNNGSWNIKLEKSGELSVLYQSGGEKEFGKFQLLSGESDSAWKKIDAIDFPSVEKTQASFTPAPDSHPVKFRLHTSQATDSISTWSSYIYQDKELEALVSYLHSLAIKYLYPSGMSSSPDPYIYLPQKEQELVDPYGNIYSTSKDYRDSSITATAQDADSMVIDYGSAGRKRVETSYIDGKRSRERVFINGRKVMEVNYKDGKLDGDWYIYDPISNKEVTHHYRNGTWLEK